MKNLTRVLALYVLATAFAGSASAQTTKDKANARARAVIAKLKASPAKPPQLAAAPILNFSLSPATALQGRQLSAYIQSDNNFSGRDLSIDLKVNGAVKASVYHPSRGLFVAPLGIQTEVKSNSIEATLFLENTQNNLDVRNAVKALDVDIRRLTNQVNAERDATRRKIFEAQRAEKVALKTELLTQLKKFRYKVGTQAYSYNVQPDTTSPTLPAINSLAPLTGQATGGTRVTISGANFSQNAEVRFGGILATNITVISENVIQATTPSFGRTVGPQDVELRFNTSGGIVNVISKNGFFVTTIEDVPQRKPVAIANGSQRIQLGATAELDGSSSYDPNGSQLDYRWVMVSAPANSNYYAGQEIGTIANPVISPSVIGNYVLELVVKEKFTDELLESDPSTAVVQVGTSPQPFAAPIRAVKGGTSTTQVFPNYNSPGDSVSFSITTEPTKGVATVSSSGLVSYTAGNTIGEDTLTVEVATQTGLTGSVVIPITIRHANFPPVPTSGSISTHTEPGQAQVFPNDPDAGQTHTYEISFQPRHGTASVNASGVVTYESDSGYVGTDLLAVKVIDNGAESLYGQVNVSVTVAANTTPEVSAPAILIAQDTSGTSQATVTDDAFQTGSFSISTPEHGEASVSTSGLVTYTPDSGFAGIDSLNVSYTDNGSPNVTGYATINVTVNGAPAVSAPAITVTTGGQGTSQVDATDPNSGQTLSYAITTQPSQGTASVSSSGLVTYSSTAGYTGADSLVVTVSDNGTPQLSTAKTISITVEPNHAPSASAPSITVAANGTATSQVTASAEDAGQTLTYAITGQPNNGSASINSSGLVSFTSNSQYSSTSSIGVTVTDNGYPNLSTSISIPVTVEGINNQPPVIPDPLFYTIRTEGVPVQVGLNLSGNALPEGGIVDPDGTIQSIVWDFGDGTQEKTFDAAQASILHNYMATGTYTATVTATDDQGASSSRQITVNVLSTDVPTAKFTASPSNGGGGTLPITITFDASASGDTDGITQYRWRFGNNPTEVVTTNPVVTRTFTSPGNGPGNTVGVRLRTRDANLAQGESNVNVTVGGTSTGAQVQAQFKVGPPRMVTIGSSIGFSGSRSFNPNVGGSVAAYNWNFGDFATCPGAAGGCTATGISTSYTYPLIGNYNSSLQVQSGGGGLSQRQFQELFVVNSGFAPKAIARASATSGVAPLTVNFSGGESYDYDGTIESHTWFFGDGSTPVCNPTCDNSGPSVSHVFQNPGFYIVRMNVQDDDGNVVGVTMTQIEVTASAQPKKKRTVPYDPDREYERQILAGACFDGNGEACSNLADMYEEDGNAFAAQHLKARACTLGYEAACIKK